VRFFKFVVLLGLAGVFGCKKEAAPVLSLSTEDLVKRGKLVYMTNCTACHGADPKKAGSIGPDVFGSSLELLRARIVLGKYPEGYTPKRATKAMAPMPFLEKDLEALAAYLN
jgi:mono/diheme cytochrome c family protein